ncbi:MAG: response regulator [Chitinophagales bacterium]|jgi:YesN/AraC family two-component response regulator|nr:response regulator [Chitinophagales bacterium]
MFLSQLNILIVEDETKVRELLYMDLLDTNLCSKIHTASHAEQAIQILKNNEIDGIFLDIQLPRMNGLEMIEALKSMDINVPVILLSAETKFEHAQKAIELGVLSFISKPWSMEVLMTSLNKFQDQKPLAPKFFFFKNGTDNFKIDIEKLIYIHSEGNYCMMYFSDGSSKLLTCSLKKMQDVLIDFKHLNRIDRFYIVNFLKIQSWNSAKSQIQFLSEKPVSIAVSRSAKSFINKWQKVSLMDNKS